MASQGASAGPGKNLPPAIRSYLRELIEDEIFSKQKEFIRCANHLNQMKWLTAQEINDQHEYYPYREGLVEKLGHLFGRRIRVPDNEEVNAYIKFLRESMSADMQVRLEKDRKRPEKLRNKTKNNSVAAKNGQEHDPYYRSHPKYKLYENHLGERRWMTQEEYERQDEFTEEVLSAGQRILRLSPWFALVIIVGASLFYFLKPSLIDQPRRGYLLVQSNEGRGEVYINEVLKLGMSLNTPIGLSTGRYRITYKKSGFETTPSYIDVDITDQDTAFISFDLHRHKTDELAAVRIRSPYPDAKVFVENDFYGTAGNNEKLYLKAGKYRISLKKENYLADPAYVDLNLTRGDSVNLSFSFSPRSSIRTRLAEEPIGLVEITTNVPDAKIIVDGKDSGQRTDYIFHKVPFGEHVVAVEKEGYVTVPQNKRVRITEINPDHHLRFTLRRSELEISLKTTPVKGKIYLDGEAVGEGEWRGELAPGKYHVRFGNVDYYQAPEAQQIEVGENNPSDFTFTYDLRFFVTFSPEGIRPKNEMGSIQIGYLDEDRQFHSDPNNAPEISSPEPLNKQVWILGYAFAYRNPPLNDALSISFDVPASVNLKNNMWLKMWGYRTDEKYPLQFTSVSEINIKINNRAIQDEYRPRFAIEEASEENFERFRINNLLRHGRNLLQISTTSVNTTYFALWKIGIE